MTLRKRINKKGGCDYASVNDNYNLLEDAIKQIKGGRCNQYSDVNSSYMLTDIKKGGNRRCKKGGNFDLLSSGTALLKQTTDLLGNTASLSPQATQPQVSLAPQASVPTASVPKASATQVSQTSAPQASVPTTSIKGGNRRGGCGCTQKKGGAVELAPFAAAVALLAARYMTDMNDNITSTTSRKTSTTSRKISRTKK